nr:hypothetical protein CFP56_79464 [Quercus suber]
MFVFCFSLTALGLGLWFSDCIGAGIMVGLLFFGLLYWEIDAITTPLRVHAIIHQFPVWILFWGAVLFMVYRTGLFWLIW